MCSQHIHGPTYAYEYVSYFYCSSPLFLMAGKNVNALRLCPMYQIMKSHIHHTLLTPQFHVIKYKQLKDGITIHHPSLFLFFIL